MPGHDGDRARHRSALPFALAANAPLHPLASSADLSASTRHTQIDGLFFTVTQAPAANVGVAASGIAVSAVPSITSPLAPIASGDAPIGASSFPPVTTNPPTLARCVSCGWHPQ